MKLATGTYGPRALKEIPRPKHKPKGRSRRGSQSSQRPAPPADTAERRYEKRSEALGTQPKGSQGTQPPPPAPPAPLPYAEPPPPRGSMEYLGPGAPPSYPPPQQLGYQPPPMDPSHLYAQPARRQRKPASDYPGTPTSVVVPVLSPMPASPIGQVAPRYSMEDVRPVQPPALIPTMPVHGIPYGGTSESEL